MRWLGKKRLGTLFEASCASPVSITTLLCKTYCEPAVKHPPHQPPNPRGHRKTDSAYTYLPLTARRGSSEKEKKKKKKKLLKLSLQQVIKGSSLKRIPRPEHRAEAAVSATKQQSRSPVLQLWQMPQDGSSGTPAW